MRVHVVGCAAFELVAQPKFAASKQTERNHTQTGRDPCDGLDNGGLAPAAANVSLSGGDGLIIRNGGRTAAARTELHIVDDSAGLPENGKVQREQFSCRCKARHRSLWPFSLKENGSPRNCSVHRYRKIALVNFD